MNHLITTENLCTMLSASRISVKKSQKHMAKALQKSLGTIQNWENGYSIPNLIDLLDWFDVLGLNPLRFILDFLHPDYFQNLNGTVEDNVVDSALQYYISDIAPASDKRKLSFCIFGNTGSSWSAQLDMLCAHNHTTMRSRVNVAQTIYDNYNMEKARNELVYTDNAMPDEINLHEAISKGKQSVFDGKIGYVS